MLFLLQNMTVVVGTATGVIIFLFLLQEHSKEFAKTLIILQKMQIMSRMLQNTYYVCNNCLYVFFNA